jgi:hypothetical protein
LCPVVGVVAGRTGRGEGGRGHGPIVPEYVPGWQ